VWDKRQPLPQTVLRKLDIHTQKTETRSLSSHIKIDSKWIKDLNVEPELLRILKLIEGKNTSRYRQ
jgi:hypothetical protein